MLAAIAEFVTDHPDVNSFAICERFGLSRGMAERFLTMLEDTGLIVLEAPSSGCSSGGCSSGGCSSGGCSSGGCGAVSTLSKLTALAEEARERKALGV